MIETLLQEGFRLLLIGMGVVFVYLGVLVVLVGLVSRMARAISGDAAGTASTPSAAGTVTADESDVVAAITAAVHRFRK